MNSKTTITKDGLINMISNKCKNDFISTEDLFRIIEESSDKDGFISKKKIISSIRNYHTKNVIKDIYNTLEEIIFNTLSSVNKEQDVCIKLFEGISLDGVYTSERMKINNLTGETNLVSSKIKPKFNITKSYCKKLNNK